MLWLRLLRRANTTERMKELAVEDEARRGGLLARVIRILRS
jgi:hypothetical protein